MSAEQILEVIIQKYSESAFAYEEWFDTDNQYIKSLDNKQEVLDHLGIGAYEVVDKYGGEGCGDTWYKVFHFTDHNTYIRIDGFYQSYNGTEFYSGYGREVFPKKKTITVFN